MDMILTNITVFVTPSFIGSLRKKQSQLHTIIYFDHNKHVTNLPNRKKMLIKVSNILLWKNYHRTKVQITNLNPKLFASFILLMIKWTKILNIGNTWRQLRG